MYLFGFFQRILEKKNISQRYVTKALRCNGFVAEPNSAGSCFVLSYYTLL